MLFAKSGVKTTENRAHIEAVLIITLLRMFAKRVSRGLVDGLVPKGFGYPP